MAEHDWREILDDPGIEHVITQALKVGKRFYSHPDSALLYDDLTSWIWDRAVDVAMWFDVTNFTNVRDPRDLWHGVLYTQLVKSIRRGDHLEATAGAAGSAKDLAMKAQRSIDREREREAGDAAFGAFLLRHGLASADPLAVLLRCERLEALIRQARYNAHHGVTVDFGGYCSEPTCCRPADARGLCATHYAKARELWIVGTCAVDGCTGPAKSRGMCPTHYEQAKRADRGGARCSEAGCDRPARTRGLCASHYSLAFQRGTHTQYVAPPRKAKVCAVPGCDATVKAKGLCNAHYLAERRARR